MRRNIIHVTIPRTPLKRANWLTHLGRYLRKAENAHEVIRHGFWSTMTVLLVVTMIGTANQAVSGSGWPDLGLPHHHIQFMGKQG